MISKESLRLAEATNFVSLQIGRNREQQTISIHQRTYIEEIINKFGLKDSTSISTPGDSHTKLRKNMSQFQQGCKELDVENVPYKEAVGCLMFVVTTSRSDIAFSVSKISQFMDDSEPTHWNAVKRIIRYLKSTSNLKITFNRIKAEKGLILTRFCDADYAGDLDSRKSTSGYMFLLNGSPITWMSRKQSIIAQSTTVAEYVALAEAGKEAAWSRQFLISIKCEQKSPTITHCDNQSAIKLVKNPEYNRRTKHIDVKFHYILHLEEEQAVQVKFIPSHDQVTDILTKDLFIPAYDACIDKFF